MATGRRFTLARKLLISFAGMGALVLVLLAIGDSILHGAAVQMESTLTAQVRPLAQLNGLQSRISRIRVLEVEMPRLVDLFAVSDQLELLRAEAAQFDHELQTYMAQPGAFTPAEASGLADNWRRYRADLARIEQLGNAMNLSAVNQIATYESAQRFKAISRVLRQGAEATERQAAKAFMQTMVEHDRQRAWFVGSSLVGLALLAGWIAWLSGSVSGRLSRLNEAAARLAAGANDPDIAVPGSDELTDLGHAFNALQAKVLAREAALRGAQNELESRVAARTEELHATNAQLLREIEERQRTEQLLQHQAQYDSLTALPNRALALDRLTQATLQARRDDKRAVLVFLDLDDFKKVNDNLGHAAGDALLQQAARRLGRSVRAVDTVARLGGDEFVVIMGDLATAEDALPVADKMLQAFAEPFRLDGRAVVVTPSIGMAVFPDDGEDADLLLRNADLAMYEAKEAGRNTYRFYNRQVYDRSVRKLAIEGHLRQALGGGELWLAFQPLMATRSKALVGAEVLLRWNNPDIGVVPPDQFIPVAEHTGLIVPIGEWVMDQACAQLAQWRAKGWKQLHVAVNVSPRQFRDGKLVHTVRDALARHGIPAPCLQIEVTEGLLVRNQPEVRATLDALSEIGVRMAMDDFGTGYSSLSYLKRFPFDVLKIDREFIRDLATDTDDRALVSAAISMGRGLGLSVVAEGVETESQFSFLDAQACEMVQGFYFSPALPAAEFEQRWLRTPAG